MSKQELVHLRDSLLDLHKALLRYQQHEYEQSHEKIATPALLFQLVTQHQSFAWLRTLSELIVGVDVFIESVTPDEAQVKSLVDYTKKLLVPSEQGNDFAKQYFIALQRSPDITLLHGKTVTLLSSF